MKANCGLHSALKGMDKNALVISIVAYYKGKEICSLYDVGPLGKVSPLPSLGVGEPLEKVSPQTIQKPIEKETFFILLELTSQFIHHRFHLIFSIVFSCLEEQLILA